MLKAHTRCLCLKSPGGGSRLKTGRAVPGVVRRGAVARRALLSHHAAQTWGLEGSLWRGSHCENFHAYLNGGSHRSSGGGGGGGGGGACAEVGFPGPALHFLTQLGATGHLAETGNTLAVNPALLLSDSHTPTACPFLHTVCSRVRVCVPVCSVCAQVCSLFLSVCV